MKLVRPKAKLLQMGEPMAWTDDFAAWQITGIGALAGAVAVLGFFVVAGA